jgi:hypothetical protein
MSTTKYTIPAVVELDGYSTHVHIGTQYHDGVELTAEEIVNSGVFGIDLGFSARAGGGAGSYITPDGEHETTFHGFGAGDLYISAMSVAEVRRFAEALRTGWSGHAASSIEPPFRHDEDQIVLSVGLIDEAGYDDADAQRNLSVGQYEELQAERAKKAMRRVEAYNNYDQITVSTTFGVPAKLARSLADELDKFAAVVEPIEQAISATA